MHTSMTNREERVKPRAGRRDAAPCLETHAFWTPGPARPQKRRLPCHRCIRQFYPGDDPLWNGCVSSVGNSSSSAWRSRERRAYRLPDEVDDLFGLSRGVASLRTEQAQMIRARFEIFPPTSAAAFSASETVIEGPPTTWTRAPVASLSSTLPR